MMTSKLRHFLIWGLVFVGALFFSPPPVYCATYQGKVVDGLDRPVKDAQIIIYKNHKNFIAILDQLEKSGEDVSHYSLDDFANRKARDGKRLIEIIDRQQTDEDGVFQLNMNGKLEDSLLDVEKEGYSGFSQSNWKPKDLQPVVLRKIVFPMNTDELLKLEGEEFSQQISEILSSAEFARGLESPSLGQLFYISDALEPVLLQLLDDPKVRIQAAELLSYFANPQSIIKATLKVAEWTGPQTQHVRNLLAGALVNVSSAEEGAFLEKCLANKNCPWWEEECPWGRCADSAVLALKANNEQKSLEMLKAVSLGDESIDEVIKSAIEFKEQNPEGFKPDADINVSIKKSLNLVTAENESVDTFEIGQIFYDQKKGKATVTASITHGPLSARGYRMTFHQVNGLWVLRGIWFEWVS